MSGLGGVEGRTLRKGDVLNIGPASVDGQERTGKNACSTKGTIASRSTRKRKLSARALQVLQPRKILRVTPGPQSDWFSESAQQIIHAGRYRVAEESNRMGLRLEGAAIPAAPGGVWRQETGKNACPTGGAGEMISEGVSLGAIQVPDGGMPIVLFVEQQTTGGYPKIANVISADFHSLGQLRPRDEIRFERVGWEAARALLREQEELMASEELILE
ncbi:MAG TPA: hypothetical protein VGR03_12545 [Candidatus Acidoferrum sp.]|nr:hypothetical protein [Candidatus Acidoferrum sp.]